MVDFWVQLRSEPQGEFWLLADAADDSAPRSPSTAEHSSPPRRLLDRPVRLVSPELLASWDVPVANWAQILPYLVSFRRHRRPLLEQSLVVHLARFTSLDELLSAFADTDASVLQASLFWLVATGRVLSPDLAVAPLGGATRFRRV